MASLFIKDPVTAGRVERMAKRLGTTKTDAVRRAFDALEEQLEPQKGQIRSGSLLDHLNAWQEANPLPPPTGLKADKAFFDELWGEP